MHMQLGLPSSLTLMSGDARLALHAVREAVVERNPEGRTAPWSIASLPLVSPRPMSPGGRPTGQPRPGPPGCSSPKGERRPLR